MATVPVDEADSCHGKCWCGKTTFAKILENELQIPAHGLDLIVWKPGWKVTPVGLARGAKILTYMKLKQMGLESKVLKK